MRRKFRACIITGYGINADRELAQAFKMVGAKAERVHLRELISLPPKLLEYEIAAFPGGFSFGDHLGSGKVFASLFKKNLQTTLNTFIGSGRLVIGICNGFQVLVKMGLLPNLQADCSQEVSLIHNDSGVFEDRWVTLEFETASPCIWTKGLKNAMFPVRHGEGKFVVKDKNVLDKIMAQKLASCFYRGPNGKAAPYPYNPNGSILDIAGICDRTGRVFGLMPHPEAFLYPELHPAWTRKGKLKAEGLYIFENGINYLKHYL